MGFFASGIMIRSALVDWATYPVITSLDSISTPINEIQFPTITVCKDETKEQPDNWAYMEKALNLLSFNCDYDNDKNNCHYSQKLKKDFRFLSENLVTVYEKWILKNLQDKAGLQALFHDTSYQYPKYEPNFNEVRQKAKNGELSYNSIKQLAINSIGKDFTTAKNHLWNLVFNNNHEGGIVESVSCGSSKNCQRVEAMVRVILEMSENIRFMPFGFFMRNFIELGDYWSFTQIKTLMNTNDEDVFDLWSDEPASICDPLTQEESIAHEYFVNLSTIAGFGSMEKTNLYELPGKLATSEPDQGNYDQLTIQVKMPQSMYYSRCKKDSNIVFGNTTTCHVKWQMFLDGLTKSNSSFFKPNYD